MSIAETESFSPYEVREEMCGVDRAHALHRLDQGMHPLCFQDILEWGRGVVRRVVPARKDPANPLLEGGYPSVIRRPEDGVWQLWAGDCYAESADGVQWSDPQPAFQDVLWWDPYIREHIIPGIPAVVLDEQAPPDCRYRMFGHFMVAPGAGYISSYVSPDGVTWRLFREKQIIVRNDSQNRGFRDTRTGTWWVYHRPGWNARMISRSQSNDADGTDFEKPRPCLEPDLHDKLHHLEPYAISVHPYDGGYLGFVKMYSKRWDNRTCWIELVVSRDGYNWQRLPDRTPIVPLGPDGAWDALCHSPGHSLVPDTGGHWFYYDSWNTVHVPGMADNSTNRIGRAFLRTRRLMECRSASRDGILKTFPMLLTGQTLAVDADAAAGELRASIERFDGTVPEGYARTDCSAITADGTEMALHFRGGHLGRFAAQPVRIVLHLTKDVSVYGLGVL